MWRTALVAAALAASLLAQTPACRVGTFGSSCGPSIDGRDSPDANRHRIRFTLTAGLPSRDAIIVFGARKVGITIPFYGCTLLTEPLAVALFRTDPTGTGRYELSLPRAFVGTLWAQAASFDVALALLETTDGARVECRGS